MMINRSSKYIQYGFLIIVLCFLVYPVSMGALNTVVTLASLMGVYWLIRNFRQLKTELLKSGFLFCFILFWVPIGLSYFGSLDSNSTLKVFINILRFLPLAAFCLVVAANQHQSQVLFYFMVGLLVLFCVDAVSEWLIGWNLHGKKSDDVNFFTFRDGATRITGVFGDKFHLGYFLATLSPLLFRYMIQLFSMRKIYAILAGVLLFVMLFVVIIVSGSRAGWLTLMVGVFLWGIYLFNHYQLNMRYLFVALVIVIVAGMGVSQLPIVKQRYNAAMFEYSAGYTWFDKITSYRTVFWKIALEEVKEKPLTGIGAGSFNVAFQKAPPEKKGYFSVAHHVHLHGLEVLTETGLIGFIAYLVLAGYLLIKTFIVKRGNEWLLVGFLALMPINTHMSIYGSFWAPMVWIPIALGLSQAYRAKHPL